MIDKEIEMDFEARAALLTNEGYFGRVRELSRSMSIRQAWEKVESELPFGLRRYTHYMSFNAAKTKEASGQPPPPVFKLE